MGRQLTFTKGHGTENDFVLVPDVDAVAPIGEISPGGWPIGTPGSAPTG